MHSSGVAGGDASKFVNLIILIVMIKEGNKINKKRTSGVLFLLFILLWIPGICSIAGGVSFSEKSPQIDIGLFNTDCGDFEIEARPSVDLIGTTVTNIQFTVRWPENTVNLVNFISAFNIVQEGPVYQSGGFNYALFISATAIPVNWTAGNEYTLLSFLHDQSGSGHADFIISDDAWTQTNNGIYYFEVLGLDETGIIYHQANSVWLETCGKIDAGIFNTGCGDFEVRLKTHNNYIGNVLTNLQFTVSWPENSVGLIDLTSDYNLQQEGPVYTSGGKNYAVFISATPISINWTAEQEYTVLAFHHDQSGTGYGDFVITSDTWTQTNNGVYYAELLGMDHTGALYHQAENSYLGGCGDIDIGIFNTACGDFEIRVKPQISFTGTTATNIQFTIRWPENTVSFIDFSSDFDIIQQGPVYQSGGFNYAVFISASTVPLNWTSGNEYVILSFSHDQTGSGYSDFIIANDAWTQTNNGQYYFEMLGLDETGFVYHQANNTWTGACDKIDAGIFSTGCGDFEVRLKPHINFSDEVMTNLQFTVSWPENSVNFDGFASDYNVQQQGPVYTSSGINYAIFISAVPLSVNWTAEEEYTVLTFNHDQSGLGYADFLIASDEWAQTNNGLYYIELLGLDFTGILYHNAENVYIGECGKVDVRVFLQGPYDGASGMMNTILNVSGNLPLNQTYNLSPWNYPGVESVTALPDSIVDWVLVELRDKDDNTLSLERRAGLLSKSGIVLDTNMTTGLHFSVAENTDSFYVVIWHRNHMPVMSGLPVAVPNLGGPYDFTEVIETQPYKHNDPLSAELELNPPGSGRYGMIAGDINADKQLKYLGIDNDRALIILRILNLSGLPDLNAVITGYFNEDITLDDKLIYIGPSNDRGLILSNLVKLMGSANLNSVYHSVVP